MIDAACVSRRLSAQGCLRAVVDDSRAFTSDSEGTLEELRSSDEETVNDTRGGTPVDLTRQSPREPRGNREGTEREPKEPLHLTPAHMVTQRSPN